MISRKCKNRDNKSIQSFCVFLAKIDLCTISIFYKQNPFFLLMKVSNSFQLTQLGGDGAFMSPNLDQSSVIEIAVPDLCRSIKMFPSDYQTVGIMNGLKFEIDPNVFNYDADENKCYCQTNTLEVESAEYDDDFGDSSWFSEEDDETEVDTKVNKECSGNGIFHLGPCKFGAPLAVSQPHYLYADPNIYARVSGMNPDPAKHHFYMVLQPQMGIGVSAYVRMQMNLKMEKSKAFPQLLQLPTEDDELVIVPIIWFEDTIESPPEDLQILLKDAIDTGPKLANSTLVICLIMAIMQASLITIYLTWSYYHSTHENASS